VGVLDASTSPPKKRYAVSKDNINRFLKCWRLTGRGEAFRAHVIAYADDFVILSRGRAAATLAWTKAVMTKVDDRHHSPWGSSPAAPDQVGMSSRPVPSASPPTMLPGAGPRTGEMDRVHAQTALCSGTR
jgi:hypothetical protein